jgi:hypothetical protein
MLTQAQLKFILFFNFKELKIYISYLKDKDCIKCKEQKKSLAKLVNLSLLRTLLLWFFAWAHATKAYWGWIRVLHWTHTLPATMYCKNKQADAPLQIKGTLRSETAGTLVQPNAPRSDLTDMPTFTLPDNSKAHNQNKIHCYVRCIPTSSWWALSFGVPKSESNVNRCETYANIYGS